MQKRGRGAFVTLCLAPSVVLYGLFVIWPLLQSFWLALFRWRGLSPQREFVGFDNFARLIEDGIFLKALANNLLFLVVGGIAIISLAVLLAHAMEGAGRASRFLRSVYLFPQIVSLVVVAILWKFLLHPSYGLVTKGFSAIGLTGFESGALGNSTQARIWLLVAFIWHVLGFYIMLFSAGIRAIPEEVREAAELDGAKGWQRFWRVTWPMLWSIKRVALIYVAINVMNLFALPWLMTRTGPDNATQTLLTYLYQSAFENSKYSYGISIAVMNFVVSMAISIGIFLVFKTDPQERRTA